MLKKSFILLALSISTTSCLFYKNATKERIDKLKQSSQIANNIQIPEDWIFDKELDSTTFDYQWISELYNSELQELIQAGLAHNAGIIIAEEKLNQIELAMGIAGANLYPTVNAIANTSNNIVNGSQIHSLGAQANWELDLWGKNKANKMASVSNYFSAKYVNEKAKQTIVAMIAKTYFLNIAGNLQEQKINDYYTLTQELEQIYQVKNKVGTGNAIDLSNIKAELLSIQNYLEKIKNANLQSKRTLELLIGSYPEGKITANSSFESLQYAIPEAIPLPLIENRPDILAQQYQIEKSFYEVQEAKAARLPSLSISSTLGVANTNINAINQLYSNPLINVGGGLATPLFNGGKLKKNVEIKNSEQQQVVEEYAKSVLNAINETESTLTNLVSIEKQLTYNEEVILELSKNIDLNKKQIEIGSSSNFELIQKQLNLLKKQMNIIDLDLQNRVERVNLYVALGAPKIQ